MGGELGLSNPPVNWVATTLGEIVDKYGGHVQTGPFGSQLHASSYVPVGIPSIMPANIGENRIIDDNIARITENDASRLSRHRVRIGNIVYSRRGDVEKRALIREAQEGWLCGTGCLKIDFGKGGTDPTFVSFYLGHPEVRAWITQHAIGATMPNLNTSIMRALPLVLPPLPEQRAIAHILGTLDDKIELNRKMNATLEEMARALFKSWFVDFDPVRAKAEGRATGLPKAIADLFPSSFVDSELGEIPKGWRVGRLGDVADVNWGDTNVTKSSYVAHGYIAYSATGPDGFLDYFDFDRTGVVVSAIGAGCGTTWLAKGKWSCIKNTLRFWAESSELSTEYLFYWCDGQDKWPRRGSAQPFISQGDSRNMRVLIPSEALGNHFGLRVNPLHESITFNDCESRTLASLRDTLLPKLISGELRVKDAEKIVGKVI